MHVFLGEAAADPNSVKTFVKTVCKNYQLPYFTLTPTFSICPEHGYLVGRQSTCPTCHEKTEIYSRVVGYLRPIDQWNDGKQAEFEKRSLYRIDGPPSHKSSPLHGRSKGNGLMKIAGFQPVTLSDYPGHVAAIVFTQGCNFRCPFCHNGSILELETNTDPFPEKWVHEQLIKRREQLTGVVVTGGEPTLQRDLLPWLGKIKELGYSIKLDTNGSNPQVLQRAIEEKVIDFIAMDVKAPLEKYAVLAGRSREHVRDPTKHRDHCPKRPPPRVPHHLRHSSFKRRGYPPNKKTLAPGGFTSDSTIPM